MNNETVRIIPLGGLEEIGKNCLFIENNKEILIVDSGLKFSDKSSFGVQFEIPDFTYLKKNKKKIKGLLITHGHLDHIGAVNYLLNHITTNIYGSQFTLDLVKKKLTNQQIKNNSFKVIKDENLFNIGSFKIHCFNVNHSIIESFGFIIDLNTKGKSKIAHMGDFNMDPMPYKRKSTNLNLLKKYKKEILLLLSDSTNSPNKGNPVNEAMVFNGLESIFQDYKKKEKIIITTFSTQVSRIFKILEISKKYNRKVLFSGRSIVDNFNTLTERPEYKSLKKQVIGNKELKSHPKITIVASGTQGEKQASLFKMSEGTHNFIKINKKDLVVFSSSIIPGNEKEVFTIWNNLAKREIDFLSPRDRDIHVTGHSVEKELQKIFDVCHPDYFIPIHGESHHLLKHKQIALINKIKEKNIFIIENGSIIEVNNGNIKVKEKLPLRKEIVSTEYKIIDPQIIEEREIIGIGGVLFIQVLNETPIRIKSKSHGVFSKNQERQYLLDLNKYLENKIKDINLKVSQKNNKVEKIVEEFFKKKRINLPKVIINY